MRFKVRSLDEVIRNVNINWEKDKKIEFWVILVLGGGKEKKLIKEMRE